MRNPPENFAITTSESGASHRYGPNIPTPHMRRGLSAGIHHWLVEVPSTPLSSSPVPNGPPRKVCPIHAAGTTWQPS
ncbi:hypothetical protein GCM10023205_46840 [Yinghuangia aomiensis]|uniref:Uncharacterized protein n=1 Tax=Yinghuangia aomiensis TaxID=676205 RepID=A0ABP9HP09_9ACTN